MSQMIKYAHVKNFKGIRDVKIETDGRMVAVFGKNGAGKSSFLDAIRFAIKPERGERMKIHHDAETGEMEFVFDDFVIRRILSTNGKLEVEHDGELVARPQEWLDNVFLGAIGDPQKFLNLKKADKVRYLLSIYGKQSEYDALEKEREKLARDRHETHRSTLAKETEVKEYEASLESLPSVSSDWPSLEELESELQAILDHNAQIESQKSSYNLMVREVEQAESSVAEYTELVASLEAQLTKAKETLAAHKKKLQEASHLADSARYSIQWSEPKSDVEVRAKIAEAKAQQEAQNKLAARQELLAQQAEAATQLRSRWRELDQSVKTIEDQMNDIVSSLPISYRLKVVDWVMMVESNGWLVPLDDLNKAAQLDLGVEICLAWPNKVKIITIEDANALDPNSLASVQKRVEEAGGQCWLETVYQTDYESIVIEDGQTV